LKSTEKLMLKSIVKSIIGDAFLASPKAVLKKVNALEGRMRSLSDAELAGLTPQFRERLAAGADIEKLMPEAFAAVREASRRVLGMRHFDVQIIGGVVLARGQIAEMKTGEGKTLVATLPAYLHALSGEGVHIVTVNDYLAHRDAEWMGSVHKFMGLTVGCIQEQMGSTPQEETAARKAAYACDITYGTNSEIVFDDLRDNLAGSTDEIVHRGFNYALVDEVDLILIDEAQTPLIISGSGDEDSSFFKRADSILRRLKAETDFKRQPRTKTATLTEEGLAKVEELLGVGSLDHPDNLRWFHAIHQSLQAHAVYRLDVDYIVTEGRVFLIDEHTGRVSEDKRFSDGLHQALEAKENVQIRSEDLTLAKTSYQYYFRRYKLLAGMSGTAFSEKTEFLKVYHLNVKRIPTNMPMIRKDYRRVLFRNLRDKHETVLAEIIDNVEAGRPTLVGSVSVHESEQLSRQLKQKGIRHEVLNAKNHEQEAEIIAQAGRKAAVTISTNMAGRGTDIILGGNPEGLAAKMASPGTPKYEEELERFRALCLEEGESVKAAGGLVVIGTGEHDSVRIDNQLRGRSGRQGDPGSSIFLISVEDDVYQKFGYETVVPKLKEMLQDHPAGEPVHNKDIEAALDQLREKVEIENQSVRLDVVKYDGVIVDRREAIWAMRRQLISSGSQADWHARVTQLLRELAGHLSESYDTAAESSDDEGLDTRNLQNTKWRTLLENIYGAVIPEPEGGWPYDLDGVEKAVLTAYKNRYGTQFDAELMEWERHTLLGIIDRLWTQFLTDVERVEEGIGLRGYGNLDPLVEFRREVGLIYVELLRDINLHAFRVWLRVDPKKVPEETAGRNSDAGVRANAARKPEKKQLNLPKVRAGGRRRKARN